jgi:hypothetical protein
MVEFDVGVLRSQCLDRRLPSKQNLIAETAAWERQRNLSKARIKWMFSTDKARGHNVLSLPTAHRSRDANQRVITTVQRYWF